MIVKYIKERGYQGEGKDPHLTLGKEYIAIDVSYKVFKEIDVNLLCDSDGTPALFPLKYFQVVDESIPPDYVFNFHRDEKRNYAFACLQPKEFTGDFWEAYHDASEEK